MHDELNETVYKLIGAIVDSEDKLVIKEIFIIRKFGHLK